MKEIKKDKYDIKILHTLYDFIFISYFYVVISKLWCGADGRNCGCFVNLKWAIEIILTENRSE